MDDHVCFIVLILAGKKTRSFSKVTILPQDYILLTYYLKLFMHSHMCFTVNTFLPVSSKICGTMKLEKNTLYIMVMIVK